jgi:osmotically-inducible protein OsmY
MPLSFLLLVVVSFSGCVPLLIGAGGVAGGIVAVRDKSVGSSVNDTKIEAQIKARLYKVSPQVFSDVSVSVEGGNVLLTGSVENEKRISVCEREAWSVPGVNAVDNNIVAEGMVTFSDLCSDGVITTKARSSLLCNSQVKSVNYKLKTMKGIVYVTGVARTAKELNTVLNVIQKVLGVKRVVSYVSVMD